MWFNYLPDANGKSLLLSRNEIQSREIWRIEERENERFRFEIKVCDGLPRENKTEKKNLEEEDNVE